MHKRRGEDLIITSESFQGVHVDRCLSASALWPMCSMLTRCVMGTVQHSACNWAGRTVFSALNLHRTATAIASCELEVALSDREPDHMWPALSWCRMTAGARAGCSGTARRQPAWKQPSTTGYSMRQNCSSS